MNTFYSHGKLLLTGEYVILDGALSLAVPTQFGQDLIVEPIDEPKLLWKSRNEQNKIWFENEFSIKQITTEFDINASETDEFQDDISKMLLKILGEAKQLNPNFLNGNTGYKITTRLDFPRNWGLGTSSTLINNIAHWAGVDAYKLLSKTFGGSGYDIACAQHNHPITYQLLNKSSDDGVEQNQKNRKIDINKVHFDPEFKDSLFFVYLNKKQNSRDGIAHYKSTTTHTSQAISEINELTNKMIGCKSLDVFKMLMTSHEAIISKVIKQKPVKELLFKDFNGAIKSLGAWGGDFVLVASKTNPTTYFKSKGFKTILTYKDMVITNLR